jgi:predicted dehydrogenase
VLFRSLNAKSDSMLSNSVHWCHKLVGGRASEMLPHPIYLVREFLGPEISVESVHVSKVGDYSWVNTDELCAVFKVGKKMGRVYASFNSPRDTIFVTVYGKEAYLKADIIGSTLILYPQRENERFSKGLDSIKQAAQLTRSTVKNVARVTTGAWDSGVDSEIKLFADALRKGEDPPVSVDEGLEVTKILEKMTHMIDKAEKANHS